MKGSKVLQWLQKSLRCETGITFVNKKEWEYLKQKLMTKNNKIENIRDLYMGINELSWVINLEIACSRMRMVTYFQFPKLF
jgi:hypothetical protein